MKIRNQAWDDTFIFLFSTLSIRTGLFPRWMALLGYALALLLLLSIEYSNWVVLVLPLWVLMVSCYILVANLTQQGSASLGSPG